MKNKDNKIHNNMDTNITDFLNILETEKKTKLKIKVPSKAKAINVEPLTFKQQKSLITSGLNGISGVMSFIKTLNDVILYNSEEEDLKIYDRIPIVLALRKELSSKKIIKDDVEVSINDLIANYKKFDAVEEQFVKGEGFEIKLKIPTLKQENRYLLNCIEELKKLNDENVGKNVSLIISYEIPKFIDSISFSDKVLVLDSVSSGDRTKIIDNLPANIASQITDYILKVREYDEMLLTIDGTTVDVDYSFFE